MPHKKSLKRGTSFVRGLLEEIELLLFDRQAIVRCRFRLRAIRFTPILAGVSPIPPDAAVSTHIGFILIAISAQRVIILKIRWRTPHGASVGSR
jgi:hypothetical protein